MIEPVLNQVLYALIFLLAQVIEKISQGGEILVLTVPDLTLALSPLLSIISRNHAKM